MLEQIPPLSGWSKMCSTCISEEEKKELYPACKSRLGLANMHMHEREGQDRQRTTVNQRGSEQNSGNEGRSITWLT
eukprot:1139507-Pelagomonas_calceolata.AAC.8